MQYLLILGKTVSINVNIGLTLEYRYLDLTCLKCIVWLTGRKDSKLRWWACGMVIYSGSWTNTQFWGGGGLSYIGCVNVACWVYDYKCSTYTTWGTSRHNSGLWDVLSNLIFPLLHWLIMDGTQITGMKSHSRITILLLFAFFCTVSLHR